MTSRLSKLVLAAVLAGSIPAAATACEPDGHAGSVYPAPPAHVPPPAPRAGWSEARRRERELGSIRAELRSLEVQRARYHAAYAGRPGKLRRYDRWYFGQRAELERRMHELQRVAWR